MKLFKKKNRADFIVERMDKLTAKRQKVVDQKNVRNSAIENKINALEYKSWSNQVKTDSVCNQLDRELDKLRRDLQSEKDYVNSVVHSEDKPRNITGKREVNKK